MEVSVQPAMSLRRSYKTTRPVVPVTSDRLPIDVCINTSLMVQLRSFKAIDIDDVHRLRTQEVVMIQTSKGSIDLSIGESQQWMDRFLPPNDTETYNLMIWIKDGQNPWEHIGAMGSHRMLPVPHIGYMIRSEWWGKSIVTKTVQAFLEHWWALPRKAIELSMEDFEDEDDLRFMELEMAHGLAHNSPDGMVKEIIIAEIEQHNIGSLRVITKCGFEYRGKRGITEREQEFTLLDYTLSRPDT